MNLVPLSVFPLVDFEAIEVLQSGIVVVIITITITAFYQKVMVYLRLPYQ